MSRKEELLAAGVALAKKYGVENVTRRMVAEQVGVSDPLVSNYLGHREEMRKSIIKAGKAAGAKFPTGLEAAALGRNLRRRS